MLYVIGSLNVGGSERHILHLVSRLERTRFAPMICCLYETGPLYSLAQAQGVPCLCLHMRRTGTFLVTLWCVVRGAAQLIRFMRRERVAIVDAYLFLAYVIAIPCAWLARVPVRIAQPRNLRTVKPPLPGRRLLERVVNRLVTLVVANSQAVAEDTMDDEGLPAHRIAVIRNGVEIPEERSGERVRPPGLPAGGRIMVCVANLRQGKGHPDLLAAAADVLPRFPDVSLALVGEGNLRAGIEEAVARYGLDARVRLLGRRDDVPALLAAADLFVLPSHEEGLPNALLEAMAHGVPVIATAVGGTPEAVEDGVSGLLVPPRDPGALAKAMTALLSDPPAARRLGQMGRARVARSFTLDRMVKETEDLYCALLNKPGRGAAPGTGR
ncbi:MAG TPA: glycosyltransferase [Candidatus Methylomirabilis sp.]